MAFTWTRADQYRSRKTTCQLLDWAEEGMISWEQLARDALGWMSEAEVTEFAQRNDYIQNDEEEVEAE